MDPTWWTKRFIFLLIYVTTQFVITREVEYRIFLLSFPVIEYIDVFCHSRWWPTITWSSGHENGEIRGPRNVSAQLSSIDKNYLHQHRNGLNRCMIMGLMTLNMLFEFPVCVDLKHFFNVYPTIYWFQDRHGNLLGKNSLSAVNYMSRFLRRTS